MFLEQLIFEIRMGQIMSKPDIHMTLTKDSNERKEVPLYSGVLKYAPAALAGMAKISKAGNDKHNPGEELHHARGKSSDHGDCIVRHLVDVADLEAAIIRTAGYDEANDDICYEDDKIAALLNEASQLLWRAAIFSQELHEKYGGAPLAPGARMPKDETVNIMQEFPKEMFFCPHCGHPSHTGICVTASLLRPPARNNFRGPG